MSLENVQHEEMCKISVCMNKALENGYCEQHQAFKDNIESTAKNEKRGSWFASLTVVAILVFIGGIIYGSIRLDELNNELGDLISTSAKAHTFIVPAFISFCFSTVIFSLGKIISLLQIRKE